MEKQVIDFKEAVENLRKQHAQADAEIAQVQEALESSGLHVTCWVTNSDVRLNPAQLHDAEEAVRKHSPDGADSDLAIQIGANGDQYQLGFCEIDDGTDKRWCLAVRAVKPGEREPDAFNGRAPIPLRGAPYWVRAKAAGKFPQLLWALADVAKTLRVHMAELRR